MCFADLISKGAFIIAELSANHGRDIEIAKESIREMKRAGADAVKVQTYTPDTITLNCDAPCFKISQGTPWDGATLYRLYREAFTPWEWLPELKQLAENLGLIFFSSPFDRTAVDFLEDLDVPLYKIASFEITDIPLIEYIAAKGKPLIISTGIATLDEIGEALAVCWNQGNREVALLKCTSSYPAPIEEANLLTIKDMADRFKCIAGLSDHTLGWTVPVVAVALGAKIIEKHFILDRKIGGPDASFSLEPNEFLQMVAAVRDTEKALGRATYELSEKTEKARHFSRSLFVSKDVKAGEVVTESNIRSIRPGIGLAPKHYYAVLGKKFKMGSAAGTPLALDMLE